MTDMKPSPTPSTSIESISELAAMPTSRRRFIRSALLLPAAAGCASLLSNGMAHAEIAMVPSAEISPLILERYRLVELASPVELTVYQGFGLSAAQSMVALKEFVELAEGKAGIGAVRHLVPHTYVALETDSARPAIAFLSWQYEGYVYNIVALEGDSHVEWLRTPWQPGEDLAYLEELVGAALPTYCDAIPVEAYQTLREWHQPLGTIGAGKASTFGTVIGYWKSNPIYSNEGNENDAKYGHNTVNGETTGLKWHCPEFVNRAYLLAYKMKIRGGNANEYFKNAKKKGLKAAENGGPRAPEVGDIIVSEGGPSGHVAIVASVSKGSLTVAHQNWSKKESGMKLSLTRTATTDRYGPQLKWVVGAFSKSYPVRGWLYR